MLGVDVGHASDVRKVGVREDADDAPYRTYDEQDQQCRRSG